MEPLPRIPGYQLIHPLGGGPLTTVYAARDGSRGLPCAVKLIREDWEDLPTAIKLLQREARAAWPCGTRTGSSAAHPRNEASLFPRDGAIAGRVAAAVLSSKVA